MMNFLAICLVLSSLTASGVWSPSPEKHQNEGQDVIVKEGHRVVVVEYGDQGQHNTRVSISDRHGSLHASDEEEGVSSSEVLRDAAKDGVEGDDDGHRHGAKELICDALGKCRHKISSAIGKAKEMASETAHQAEEAAVGKVHDVEEKTKETVGKVKDKASEQTHHLKDGAKEAAEKGREKVEEAKESVKKMTKKVPEIVEKSEEEAKARGKEAMEDLKKVAEAVKDESHRGLNALFRGVRKLIIHSSIFMAFPALASAVSLLGFAMAFGMSVWMTFISSYVLARAMPRHQFAVVQSKIYPVYFRAMITSIAMAFLGHLLGHTRWPSSNTAWVLQGYNLFAALPLVLINSFYVEPLATKVMFEKIKAEKEEGRGRGETPAEINDSVLPETRAGEEPQHGPVRRQGVATPEELQRGQGERRGAADELNRRLKELNSFSSFLNIITLMALSWHLVYLNQRLSPPV